MSAASGRRWWLLWLALSACRPVPRVRPPPERAATSRERARVHTWDGALYVLERWSADGESIRGEGEEYNAARVRVREGSFLLRRAEVALIETTELRASSLTAAVAGLSVVTGASLGVTAACIAMPKSCFGSCPTFYVPSGEGWTLQAEGFSTSVARSLEAVDVDDLHDARPEGGALALAVRNEALETHFLRAVSLLTVDGPEGSTPVRRASGGFDAVGPAAPPECASGDAPCVALQHRDGREHTPGSDGEDLAARGEVVLRFPPPGRRDVSLVLVARNSLMSTWVFYHLLALQGRSAGEFIAALERREPAALGSLAGFDAALGGVAVSWRQGSGEWSSAGEVGYLGPIARATRAVPIRLEDPSLAVQVRLSFARAHWRLDAAALGPLVATDLPSTVSEPEVTATPGVRSEVERSLRGEGERLVLRPGDEVRLRFVVPSGGGSGRGYFLQSRGYYYEWLRTAWLRDEDRPRAVRLLSDPARALRELAREYHEAEPGMEAIFRASRFSRGAP